MDDSTCQATQSNPVEVEVPSQSPDGPYRLCKEAAERLRNRTLRPLEWYRLASIHGPFEYHLQDDFYDDDGAAAQPIGEITDAFLYPIPQLSDVKHDLEMLLDYTITRRSLEEPELTALKQADQVLLATTLEARRTKTSNPFVCSRLYEICGDVLGTSMKNWVRNEYSSLAICDDRLSLLKLAGACLPAAEAKKLTINELSRLHGKELVENILTLSPFQEESTLDWIESNICDPWTGQWGDLAAVAGLTWDRAKKWLEAGRPLALIALDALVCCDSPRLNQSLLIQEARPKLLNSPDPNAIKASLEWYHQRDPTPRVRKAIEYIIQRIDNIRIVGGDGDSR